MPHPYRRIAATLALLALTVVPTLYVAGTAWRVRRPEHRREVEAEVSRVTGLGVTIGALGYPRPGEVVYRGVVFREGGPGRSGAREIARAGTLRLRRRDGEWTLDADGLRLQAGGPRDALERAVAALGRAAGRPGRLRIFAPECTVDLGPETGPVVLREFDGRVVLDGDAPTLRAAFRVALPGATPRCELSLARDRTAEPARTSLTVKTAGGLPLPSKVLDPFFGAEDWLGPSARVDGALTLTRASSGPWGAEFRGNLHDVDLGGLVRRRFPSHRLQGKARIGLDLARWADRPGQGPGWVEVRGEVVGGPGTVRYGLLQALKTEMQFRVDPGLARIVSAGVVDLDYRALGFRFALTGQGEIRVDGGLGNAHPAGSVMAGAPPTAPIALAPTGAANVRGLIRALFPMPELSYESRRPLIERSRLFLSLPVPPDVTGKPIGGN